MRTMRRVLLVLALAWGALAATAGVLKLRLRSRGGPDDDELDLVSIWSGTRLRSSASAFRGGRTLTWWGGTQLDLRDATLAEGGASLHTRTLWGGTDITVGPGVRVVMGVRALMGGCIGPNELDPNPGAAAAPTLTVSGWVVFGGLRVSRPAPDAATG